MYVEKRDLQRHIRSTHEGIKELFSCDKCDKTYQTQGALRSHIQVVHKGLKHKCSQCSKEYVENRDLQKHFCSTHEGIKELFPCDKCDKTYQSRDGLRSHIQGAHKGLKHTCSLLLLLLHTKVWCKIPLLSHHGYAMALHHHHDDVKALHGHGDHVKKPTWHRKAFEIKRFFFAASGDRTRDLPSHSLVS